MTPTTLLVLTALLQPELLADRHPQLPDERACAMMYQAANEDRAALAERYRAMTGVRLSPAVAPWEFPSWEPEAGGGGWQAQQLRQQLRECDHIRHTWCAALWLRRCSSPDPCDTWAERLALLVGHHAFWRGELPLPFSLR